MNILLSCYALFLILLPTVTANSATDTINMITYIITWLESPVSGVPAGTSDELSLLTSFVVTTYVEQWSCLTVIYPSLSTLTDWTSV